MRLPNAPLAAKGVLSAAGPSLVCRRASPLGGRSHRLSSDGATEAAAAQLLQAPARLTRESVRPCSEPSATRFQSLEGRAQVCQSRAPGTRDHWSCDDPPPPRRPPQLTWCALGEARLLDDSELGLRSARLGLQGRRGPFPGQALGRLGAAGVSGQHSRVVRRGRGTSVLSKRRWGTFKGKALIQPPCSNNVLFCKKRGVICLPPTDCTSLSPFSVNTRA